MALSERGGLPTATFIPLLLLSWLLSACQTVPPPANARTAPQQQLDVPFIPQDAYQCGPAALGMMLQWNGLPGEQDELVREVWLPERQGALGMELRAAGRARGLLAYPVETPEALFAELQAGHPVLIMQNLSLPSWPTWHFAVVIGYRDGGKRMLLHSGTDEATSSRWNRFLRTWARARYRGFVLLPAGELPARVEPEPLLRALAPMRTNAVPHWQTAVARFPDNGRLHFGLANALWAADRRAEALDAYQRTVRLAPELAPAWNNLAYALQDAGDHEGGRQAICHAAELAPEDGNIRASVLELNGGQGC